MTFQYQKRDQAQIQVPRGCPKLKSLRLAQALQHSALLRLAEKITKLFFFIRKTGALERNDIEEEKKIFGTSVKKEIPHFSSNLRPVEMFSDGMMNAIKSFSLEFCQL